MVAPGHRRPNYLDVYTSRASLSWPSSHRHPMRDIIVQWTLLRGHIRSLIYLRPEGTMIRFSRPYPSSVHGFKVPSLLEDAQNTVAILHKTHASTHLILPFDSCYIKEKSRVIRSKLSMLHDLIRSVILLKKIVILLYCFATVYFRSVPPCTRTVRVRFFSFSITSRNSS